MRYMYTSAAGTDVVLHAVDGVLQLVVAYGGTQVFLYDSEVQEFNDWWSVVFPIAAKAVNAQEIEAERKREALGSAELKDE